jgi:hypothetical protein
MAKAIWNLLGYGTGFYIWAWGMSDFSKQHPGWTGAFLIISAGFVAYKLASKND